ncbi:Pre-rRNA-processing protein PNO1 [Aureobasidium sp. EXF-12298]|nr:Pre-rRNA-processing protein PNO1 [Aureobasidium sp. EXF-12298]KAI4765392.1 Pre-rRNA-processing protein PNO1 [Aureobasidium sp. EXF-12344]KAI4783150.1 Pre-rRNA-processing protein PNO1 [Aureobasidium sp. EXF-3400]
MPAPTALQRAAPEDIAQNLHETPVAANNDDDEMLISTTDTPAVQDAAQPTEDTAMTVDSQPLFAAEKASNAHVRSESRKVAVPPHRWTPLKNAWPKVYPPLVEHLKLQCRVNTKNKNVELRTSRFTEDTGALQKGADFIHAFCLGFDLDDAIALLRLDDLYIETFEIKDVKTLQGEHLGRAIGRIAGKDGKTKHAIENASKTRVVLADSKIHILGGFKNIHMARTAIVSLILGSPPAKVYGNLRTVASRMKERF